MSYWNETLRRRISRRRALAAFGGTAAGAALLAACGGNDDGGGSKEGSGNQATNTQAKVKTGGNLRIGYASEQHNLDPHVQGQNRTILQAGLIEPLTTFDEKVQPIGALAESWEQANGGLTTVMHLRKNASWHSGRPFTSDDVKWSLDRVKDPNVPFAAFATMAKWFSTIELPDKNTIILKSDAPRPCMWDFFNVFKMGDRDTAVEAKTIVGTGPFKFVEWKQGQTMKWVKNPTWWQKDMAYLDEVTWNTNMDPEAALAQLEAGGLDVVLAPTINGFVRFQGNSNFTAMVHPAPGGNFTLGTNTNDKPYTDKRVRQAFNWAIDRKRLEELVMKKTVKARSLPWNSSSPAFEASKDQFYNLDLKKSKDLLAAAGAPNPSTTLIHTSSFIPLDFLQIWQNDLKSIGATMNIQVVESAAFPPLVNAHPLQYHSHWAASVGQAGGVPTSMFVIQATSYGGDGISNNEFKDETYMGLVAKVATEMDTAKAKPIWSQLNDMILDHCFLIPICPQIINILHSNKVAGITPNMIDAYDYYKAGFV